MFPHWKLRDAEMKSYFIKTFLFTLALTGQSAASDWAEAEKLQRLVQHLEASKALLAQAKANTNPNKRLQFDYEALEMNITEIKQGIELYLSKPLEPRSYDELKNSFSTYEDK
jgi:RAQPRD family integrative conjugative element protein